MLSLVAVTVLTGCSLASPDGENDASSELVLGQAAQALANNQEQTNLNGASATFSTQGSVAQTGPFFESIGQNGRRCVDCHQPDQGWTITPSRITLSFARSSGKDPVFRPVDGAVSPEADVSTTQAKRTAYNVLLGRGLIRVGLGIPANAEFTLDAVDDPYGFASAGELSLFRRPLPATNLRFHALVMWDGRESPDGRDLDHALLQQSEDATLGHAQALLPPSDAQRRAIVDFEFALHNAQIRDTTAGALGGPAALVSQPFHLGINDPLGDPETGAAFDPRVFTLFDAWRDLNGTSATDQARAAIARGQEVFNTKPLTIRNTPGLSDDPAFGTTGVVQGTCGTCHNTPNVGTHSSPRFINLGIGSAARRTPDMPLYTLRNKATGATTQTSDPGRALITGKWNDIQKFKVPSLRGLSARPPYFHNGQSLTLEDVVAFYNGKFRMNMSDAEKSDLVAFLKAL
jgi:cytochrome c peroxidase